MARKNTILDRYEVIGTAGSGGFGTVQIAWDPRIQRKVAIKTIALTERDAYRAALPGAEAVAKSPEPEASGEESAVAAAPVRRKTIAARTPAQIRAARAAERAAEAEAEAVEESLGSEPAEEAWHFVGKEAPVDEEEQPAASPSSNWRGVTPWGEYIEAEDAREGKDTRSLLDLPEVLQVPEIFVVPPIERPDEGDEVESESDYPNPADTAELEAVTADGEGVWDQASLGEEVAAAFEPETEEEEEAAAVSEEGEAFEEALEEVEPAEPWQDGWNSAALAVDPITSDEPTVHQTMAFPSKGKAAVRPQGRDSADQATAQVTSLAHLPGLDEARTAAKLSDSRIVTVYDFEVRDRTAYLIMEYVEGITLTELLADYADVLTLDMVTGVFEAVAGALMVAHKAGVLHLDIKPDNILINREGQAKVTDFGLATLADASGTGTTGGGTIGYMPLEQMRREGLDARTDEWALAAVTYEMLTGDNPFFAENLKEAEGAILDAELVLPSLCWTEIDEQIDDVIFFALDPDIEERYSDVKDFSEEMEKFLGDGSAGKEELALVVNDALDGDKAADGPDEPEEEPPSPAFGLFPWQRRERGDDAAERPREERRRDHGRDRDERNRDEDFGEAPEERRGARGRRERDEGGGFFGRKGRGGRKRSSEDFDSHGRKRGRGEPTYSVHVPLIEKIPDGLYRLACHGASGAGSAFVGALGLSNLSFIGHLAGDMQLPVVLIGAAVFAAVGALLPFLGTVASFELLGLAITLAGHPLVGVFLMIAAGLWWYITGREGFAEGNVAFGEPVLGAIGLGPAVPLFAGVSLRPLPALVTALFAVVVAMVLGSFGSLSLIGWDAPAHWLFTDADITRNFGRMLANPLNWAAAGGWILAAVGFSLLRMQGSRWSLVLGLAVGIAALIVGVAVFAMPTPQFFVAILAAAVVICVLLL